MSRVHANQPNLGKVGKNPVDSGGNITRCGIWDSINDIKGEKTIDLSYPIHSKKEIAVASMHIINSQIFLHRSIEVLSITSKKIVLNKGVHTDNELIH